MLADMETSIERIELSLQRSKRCVLPLNYTPEAIALRINQSFMLRLIKNIYKTVLPTP